LLRFERGGIAHMGGFLEKFDFLINIWVLRNAFIYEGEVCAQPVWLQNLLQMLFLYGLNDNIW
jgi:hypothetical protein